LNHFSRHHRAAAKRRDPVIPCLCGRSRCDATDRQARRVTSALLDREVLTSESTRAPLRLAFPAKLASRWMLGLFPPEQAG